jgi:hypothetical protein
MTSNEDLLKNEDNNSLLMDDGADDLFIKPIKKRKILFLSDHQLAPSGVGVQSRFLIDGLNKTGKYTFRCLGGAIKHQKYETIAVNPDFIVKPVDGFGTKEMIRDLLLTEKPDAVFLFTDPRQFIWLWEMEDEIHQVCPIVYWHVWDNDPYPKFNSALYDSCDLINCISKKTHELVKPNFPERTHYIPHAFPKEVFYPIGETELESLKEKNFGDKKDWFKVLWVNRNAMRKMPNDVLASWNMFLKNLEKKHGHKNAVLIMHTDPKDREGPDLLATTEQLGIQPNVWFSTDKIDFEKMNTLHNLTDCMVNISKAEGYGLTSHISLQCGKPVILLCTGGETSKAFDPLDGSPNGVALRPVTRSLVGSQMVPYIYEDFTSHEDVSDAFMKIYEMTPEEKVAMKKKTTEYIARDFSFESVVSKWDETLTKTIDEFKEKQKVGNLWNLTLINPSLKSDNEEKA